MTAVVIAAAAGTGTAGTFDMHIETGRISSVGTGGTSITFATNFGSALHSEGDYVVWAWGISATNAFNHVFVGLSAQTGAGMTIMANQPNTVVRWVAVERTQREHFSYSVRYFMGPSWLRLRLPRFPLTR